jgi:hypothetical protein
MASPASIGQTIAQAIAGTRMGERSAIKLEFNEVGTVSPEVGAAHGTTATAQLLTLPTFSVPNTAIAGDFNFGKNLFADAEVVTGSIGATSQLDYYMFSGTVGDVINAEVVSTVPSRFGTTDINPQITLYRPDGTTVVALGTGSAFNDNEFESVDSALIDIVLPVTGTFYVKVNAATSTDTGNYELYLYRFRAEVIPEPATFALLPLALFVATGIRSRRDYHHG